MENMILTIIKYCLQILGFSFSSYIICSSIWFKSTFDLFKSVADKEYIINKNNVNFYTKNHRKNKFLKYTPIVNIFFALKNFIKIKIKKDEAFKEFKKLNVIQKMKEDEKNSYNKKTSSLNSIILTDDSKLENLICEEQCINIKKELDQKLIDEIMIDIDDNNLSLNKNNEFLNKKQELNNLKQELLNINRTYKNEESKINKKIK